MSLPEGGAGFFSSNILQQQLLLGFHASWRYRHLDVFGGSRRLYRRLKIGNLINQPRWLLATTHLTENCPMNEA